MALGEAQEFTSTVKVPMRDRQELCRRLGTALLKAGRSPKDYFFLIVNIGSRTRGRLGSSEQTRRLRK